MFRDAGAAPSRSTPTSLPLPPSTMSYVVSVGQYPAAEIAAGSAKGIGAALKGLGATVRSPLPRSLFPTGGIGLGGRAGGRARRRAALRGRAPRADSFAVAALLVEPSMHAAALQASALAARAAARRSRSLDRTLGQDRLLTIRVLCRSRRPA